MCSPNSWVAKYTHSTVQQGQQLINDEYNEKDKIQYTNVIQTSICSATYSHQQLRNKVHHTPYKDSQYPNTSWMWTVVIRDLPAKEMMPLFVVAVLVCSCITSSRQHLFGSIVGPISTECFCPSSLHSLHSAVTDH